MAGEKPTKGTHGGKRPGAGRRPKEIRDARDACNKAMDKVVIPEFERIFRTLVDMAAGTPDAPPDPRVGMYLVDRYLGRPTQALKVIPRKDLKALTDEELDAIAQNEG
jgi:hypothetical protein